ncbi:helix-turn-helix domain-containing protein [bacterium]|nr:helix-turn-helix domain-containing protein [bacterium]
MNSPSATAIQMIEDNLEAAAVLDPLRLQILEGLREPDSAAGLARRFGIPRQKVNYHLRQLEKHGFLEAVEERRKGNCTERIVRATARAYLISPQALGSLAADPDKIQDHFSSTYLVAVAARAIQELAVLREQANQANKKLATFTLQTSIRFASTADRNEFAREVSNAFANLSAKYHDEKSPGGRTFRVFAGAYPAITKIHKKMKQEKKS